MGLYHNHLRSKSSAKQISASSPPAASSPSSSNTLGRSDVQFTINNEKASIFHLCYFAEAIYASAGLKWRYGKPDPIIQLPISPNSRFRLTVEVRANICSPSYGTPWPELEGCVDKGDFHMHGEEGLYGQVQIAFILRKAPETDWRHNSTGNTTSLSQHNQQRQQRAPQPQLTFLEPMFYVPKLFLPTADPSSVNDLRIACGQPVDHQHPGKAGLPYPAVLEPEGYLGLCHLGERANQLLTEGQATSMREPALPDGLIPAVRWQLREALRWGMAAELLGRLPVEGEPLVLDEAEFAGLEGELEAATAPLGKWTFLTALMLALGKLREGMLGYEAAKDGAGGENV
ncbi:hypothetical protein PG991_012375 [Apiospora marii]|uniref:Uncharacterized protein n=1 Tax=Apiospora marii TaxID=335849 RepID=A0ABR1R9J0_9PEZI